MHTPGGRNFAEKDLPWGPIFWQKGALKLSKTLPPGTRKDRILASKIPPPEGHRVAKLAANLAIFDHPNFGKKGEIFVTLYLQCKHRRLLSLGALTPADYIVLVQKWGLIALETIKSRGPGSPFLGFRLLKNGTFGPFYPPVKGASRGYLYDF